jgi:hypothetical protein
VLSNLTYCKLNYVSIFHKYIQYTHTILEHYCNTCKRRGHTSDRCGKPLQHLEEFATLPDNLKHTLLHRMQNCKSTYASLNECRIEGCKYPKTHLTVYHTCGECSKMGHNTRICGYNHKNRYISCC